MLPKLHHTILLHTLCTCVSAYAYNCSYVIQSSSSTLPLFKCISLLNLSSRKFEHRRLPEITLAPCDSNNFRFQRPITSGYQSSKQRRIGHHGNPERTPSTSHRFRWSMNGLTRRLIFSVLCFCQDHPIVGDTCWLAPPAGGLYARTWIRRIVGQGVTGKVCLYVGNVVLDSYVYVKIPKFCKSDFERIELHS